MSDVSEDYPATIQVEPTNYCNFACPRCPTIAMKYPRGVMDESVFAAIVDELSGKYVAGQFIALKMFYLGEPMLCGFLVGIAVQCQ